MTSRRSIARFVTSWHICSRNSAPGVVGSLHMARSGARPAAISGLRTKNAVMPLPFRSGGIGVALFTDVRSASGRSRVPAFSGDRRPVSPVAGRLIAEHTIADFAFGSSTKKPAMTFYAIRLNFYEVHPSYLNRIRIRLLIFIRQFVKAIQLDNFSAVSIISFGEN